MNIPEYKGIGVYCIRNTSNGKEYIGSTYKIRSRALQHLNLLKKGKHPVAEMQKDFDSGDLLYFTVLREFPLPFSLVAVEKAQIYEYQCIVERDTVNKGYNRTARPVTARSAVKDHIKLNKPVILELLCSIEGVTTRKKLSMVKKLCSIFECEPEYIIELVSKGDYSED